MNDLVRSDAMGVRPEAEFQIHRMTTLALGCEEHRNRILLRVANERRMHIVCAAVDHGLDSCIQQTALGPRPPWVPIIAARRAPATAQPAWSKAPSYRCASTLEPISDLACNTFRRVFRSQRDMQRHICIPRLSPYGRH